MLKLRLRNTCQGLLHAKYVPDTHQNTKMNAPYMANASDALDRVLLALGSSRESCVLRGISAQDTCMRNTRTADLPPEQSRQDERDGRRAGRADKGEH